MALRRELLQFGYAFVEFFFLSENPEYVFAKQRLWREVQLDAFPENGNSLARLYLLILPAVAKVDP